MKKLALLCFITIFISCSLEDDGAATIYEYAKVIDAGLPDSFERGKIYQLKIIYLLPSACHSPLGIEARRGGIAGEERRKIYIAGFTSVSSDMTDCAIESEDLEREKILTITIDEGEPYTFYLWNGLDNENENQYVTIEVPVLDQDDAQE